MRWALLLLCTGCGAVDPITVGKLVDASIADASAASTPDTSESSEEEEDGLEQEGENE